VLLGASYRDDTLQVKPTGSFKIGNLEIDNSTLIGEEGSKEKGIDSEALSFEELHPDAKRMVKDKNSDNNNNNFL